MRGLGPLAVPVPASQAKQLCMLGRPARYGRGEQTLVDQRVRDTWEIPKARVKLDKRRWNKTLLPMLDRLRDDLGLPSGSVLKAELHSMLVYAPGQFFVPHQDTEKADAGHRDQALSALGRPVLAVLESASVIAATGVRDEALGMLCEETDDLLPCLMAVVRAERALPKQRRQTTKLDALVRHCARRLEMRLARPPRRDDDWSIELGAGCACELCDVLGGFLAAGARRTLEWPLAKDGRRHVHARLERAELPVTHQTRRTGRPYTLVLTKTDALFEGDRHARRRDKADLAWLRGRRKATAPAAGRGAAPVT